MERSLSGAGGGLAGVAQRVAVLGRPSKALCEAPDAIRRTLRYYVREGEWTTIGEDAVTAFEGPIVILGDPGLGKTVLSETLGARPDMAYCPAGTFVRAADPGRLIGAGERVVIDGLDEIASAQPGAAIHAVLGKLSEMGNPPFIVSCRAVDWRSAPDAGQIAQDYGAAPVVLHLQPLSLEDARGFLSSAFPAIDPMVVVEHLRARGLDALYGNPLTLRLLGEVALEGAPLPRSRAELLERACRAMASEENPLHQGAAHALMRPEDLLIAAGAICAVQLLCDRIGVFTGSGAHVPEGFLSIAEVDALPFCEAGREVVRTRLFRALGEGRFTHVHRVIAEYLGAAWLARCVRERSSERRVFSLFRPGDGVPTSLRGLHAWIGHFERSLSGRCIAADPYAVLRYGDAETIGVEEGRALLAALRRLAQADPFFVSEDWGRHRAAGLMRLELRDDVEALVTAPDRNPHLSVLVLNAMVGTQLATALAALLESITFDPTYGLDERSCAAEALRSSSAIDDWEAALRRLLAQGDADSAEVASELLATLGAQTVSIPTGVETVLAHLRITQGDVPPSDGNRSRHLAEELFAYWEPREVAGLLDELAARAEPLYESAGWPARSELADLVLRLVAQVLEAGVAPSAQRLWAWLRWIGGHDGYYPEVRRRLTEALRGARALRAALLEHVLLTPCGEGTWMAAHALGELQLDLLPTDEDVAVLLAGARERAGEGAVDEQTWRGLLLLGRKPEGLAQAVRQAALEAARGDPALLDVLASVSETVVGDFRERRAAHEALQEVRRQGEFRRHRDALNERLEAVAAGNFLVLEAPADAYLGRWSSSVLDCNALPEVRLSEVLGETLCAAVCAGFIAVLHRTDLPSASAIASLNAGQARHRAQHPMICGVAELLRQNQGLDGVRRETLAAVYMAWRAEHDLVSAGGVDIGPALEDVLFADERGVEAHFRMCVEPQLAAGREHVVELYRLTHEARWAPVAGRLAVDWLRTYGDLPVSVQTALVQCAIESEEDDLARRLDVGERIEHAPDQDARLLWLSAAFVLEFESRRDALRAAAATEPDLIWRIRDRLGEQHREDFSWLCVSQLVFIVESFGKQWPVVSVPTGVIMGDSTPWDATMFIRGVISAIAARPCSEATEALQHLIDCPAAASYTVAAKHALAQQRKARRDFEYCPPSLVELHGTVVDGLPESVDGMRACLLDRLDDVQIRMHASNTDTWEVYWRHDGVPRGEDYCRNRLVEQLLLLMPDGVQIDPEARMPRKRRVDFVASHAQVRLPIEIKGQWHRKLWSAALEQLDAYYTREWRAQGRGVYVVFWFGDVRERPLPAHPDGLERPETAKQLRSMLVERLPEERRAQIDVVVLDVQQPA